MLIELDAIADFQHLQKTAGDNRGVKAKAKQSFTVGNRVTVTGVF